MLAERLLFSAAFTLGEQVRRIAGFDDVAVMSDAIQKGGCHLGITEDRDPFAELKVGCDDDAIQRRQLPNDLPCIAVGLFLDPLPGSACLHV